jgi:large subunit ribosomal protein L30
MPIQLPITEEFLSKKYLKDNIVMAKVKITQIKSKIGSTKKQVATLEALGLRKMNQTVIHEATPQVIGMAKKVSHLVRVEEV